MGGARDDTAARVIKILVGHLWVAEADVRPETLLVPEHYERGRKVADGKPDLGADSLDVVELAMAIEEEFCIEIADDDAEKLNRATVGELIDFVHQCREANDAGSGGAGQREPGHA